MSEIAKILETLGLMYHQYADDLMIYLPLSSIENDLKTLSDVSYTVQRWFLENFLLLNPDKTEAIVFGTRQRLSRMQRLNSIDVANDNVKFVDHVKLLGVTLDSSLTFDRHVSNVVRDCSYQARALRHIRPLLNVEAARKVGSAVVGSRLDYCNSLLNNTTDGHIKRLQVAQNNLPRVVLQAPRSSSATELRKSLHWLPVNERIRYKIATMTFKAKNCGTPAYLNMDLQDYRQSRVLRSSSKSLLHEPPSSSVFASGAFSSAAPRTWNSLEVKVRKSNSYESFKKALKTELFKKSYNTE